MKKVLCGSDIDGVNVNDSLFVDGHLLRESIFNLVKKDYPDFTRDCYVNKKLVKKYRNIHLESLINKEDEKSEDIDKSVIDSILTKKIISDNIEDDLDEDLSFGQRIADKVAEFGGSWAFIISFSIFIIFWVIINVWILVARPFDPYPFILLNLFLSTLAAIQAPVIMMSQNRQEEKDRK